MNKDIAKLNKEVEDFLSANQALFTGERFELEEKGLLRTKLEAVFRMRQRLNDLCVQVLSHDMRPLLLRQ